MNRRRNFKMGRLMISFPLAVMAAVVSAFAPLPTTLSSARPFRYDYDDNEPPEQTPSRLPAVVAETDMGERKFMYMTKEQDALLLEKGNHEASLMTQVKPLKPSKVKRSRSSSNSSGGGGGGFGKPKQSPQSKKDKTAATTKAPPIDSTLHQFQDEAASYARILETEGLVRIDNVLPPALADALKEYLVDLRARATRGIEDGSIGNSQERFADVLLNQNRCDLKIPLGPAPVHEALQHLLQRTCLRSLFEGVFEKYGAGTGSLATLYELNCFMSNTGARRQLVHSDNACVEDQEGLHPKEPIMLTCFVALQDTDHTMGPTTWIPGTHNVEAHRRFYEVGEYAPENHNDSDEESPKDQLLRTSKAVMGTLPKGSCAVFDPRVLHCAGANHCEDPTMTRAMFYISFKNPRVDNPGCPSCGGYGIANAELTMETLCRELEEAVVTGGPTPRLDVLACFP